MPRNRLLCGLLLFCLAVPLFAQDERFEVTVAEPGAPDTYTESFPTDAQATTRLWNKLRINALQEQTRSLRVDFAKFKKARFERQTSIANQATGLGIPYQPQPEHYPAFMVTGIRW